MFKLFLIVIPNFSSAEFLMVCVKAHFSGASLTMALFFSDAGLLSPIVGIVAEQVFVCLKLRRHH